MEDAHENTRLNKMASIQINTSPSLWSNGRQIYRRNAEEVIRQLADYNARRTNDTRMEMLKGDPVEPTSQREFDRCLTAVKPYFDYDETISPAPDAASLPAILEERLRVVREGTESIIRGALPYRDVDYEVHCATRHGMKGEGFKVSKCTM